MAVNFVDLEVLPPVSSAPVVLPVADSTPVIVEPPSPPVVVTAAPVRAAAALDRSPSYWVRRRREQELIARALIDETSG